MFESAHLTPLSVLKNTNIICLCQAHIVNCTEYDLPAWKDWKPVHVESSVVDVWCECPLKSLKELWSNDFYNIKAHSPNHLLRDTFSSKWKILHLNALNKWGKTKQALKLFLVVGFHKLGDHNGICSSFLLSILFTKSDNKFASAVCQFDVYRNNIYIINQLTF